jgi:heat shock protein HtpX
VRFPDTANSPPTARGAFLTTQPSALASALVKITGEMGRIPQRDLREAEPYNAFFFAPALAPGFSLSSMFSTHPPIEKRLEQLGRISAQLGRPL